MVMRTKLGFFFIVSLLLVFLSGYTGVQAQNREFFVITGKLSTDDGNDEGTEIVITKNNIEQQRITPPRSGRFRFEFEYNNEFHMIFRKEGYYKKIIVVSTLVPPEILKENNDFPPLQIEVSLVKEIPGIDKSFTNKPTGRVYYNANIDNFDTENYLTDLQFEEQANTARSQQRELNEEEKIALAQREKDYQQAIADADALFQQKKYEDALAKFQSAHGLFPERPYPNDRIEELQDLVSALKIAEQRRLEADKEYLQTIAQADDSFNQKSYDRAKQIYAQALELKPEDSYATGQIAKADELINQQKIDLQYNSLITDAEQRYNEGNLQGAREVYQQALLVKPEEASFINEQIKKIENELALQVELAQKEKQYNELMEQGAKEMNREKYNEALLAFRQALALKPNDELASSRITEAEQIILQAQNRENYARYIADADKAMKKNDIAQAKSLYQEAMKYLPDETYPKDQIAAIDETIARSKQFDQLVSQANTAAGQQNFEQAKQLLQQALEIKDDSAVREEIKRIDQQLAQIELENNYADLLKRADEAKNNEQYEIAKSLYNQALALKKEDYPANQIRQIEEEEARLADLKKLEQQFAETVANAEDAFKREDFATALDGFKAALALKPDNQLMKDRIRETNEVIIQRQNKQQFDGLVAQANEAFNKNNLEQAKDLYQQALLILPNEQFPKDQMALIDQRFSQLEEEKRQEEARLAALAREQQRKYDLAVQKGDSLYKLDEYESAKQSFQLALSVKPEETYPKEQIAAIEGQLAKLVRLTASYNKAVDAANQLAKKEQYEPAKSKYQEALQYLPDEEYPKQQIERIDGILAQIDAERQRQEDYLAAIHTADSLLNLKEYEPARASYQQAISIKSNEIYPKQKIAEIDEIFAELEKARLAAEAKRKNYDRVILQADGFLAERQYDSAKSGYNEALTILPDENYPKEQLAKIDQMIAQEREDAFKQAIASGDQLFAAEKYSESQSAYNNALKIKPDDQYARDQVVKISDIMEQMAQNELQKQKLEKEFGEKLKNADLAFNNSQFENAKTLYEQASSIKPDETYPREQIAKVDSLLQDLKRREEINQQYIQAVRKAENAVSSDQLELALNFFKEAASYKPDEPLPKKRISEIEDQIAKREELARLAAEEAKQKQAVQQAKQEKYDAALANAQTAFENEAYANAKNYLVEALNVFPDEQYPKDRIAQIDLLIEQQSLARMERQQQAMQDSIARATQLAFDKKMQQAGQLENNEQFNEAIASFNEAKEILPENAGEVDLRIKQVRDKISARKELEANYANAIQRADGYFNQEDWEKSLEAYQEALAYKPDETYPNERVRFINQKVGNLEKNYADAIQQADQFFGAQNWNNAKGKYSEALNLKPNEQYPADQLAIVNGKIREEQLAQQQLTQKEQAYRDAITLAEKSFVDKQLNEAKLQFQAAKNIKPEETYPDQRIAEIDSLLAEQAADEALAQQQKINDQRYEQAIVSADQAFKFKNYDQAKVNYQNALTIKPNEQYPQSQLDLIEQLMKKVEEPVAEIVKQPVFIEPAAQPVILPKFDKEDYSNFIVSADSSYNQQNYNVAQFYYQKAHQTKPEEAYPKQRLNEISELINRTMNKNDLAKYDDAIKQADQAFKEKHYSISKFYYYKALAIKSWEQYPKDQIAEIHRLTDSLLSELKEKQYQDLITKADESFVRKEYGVARAYYNRSLSIKTDEEYPKIKLSEISKLVQQELANAENKSYQDMIAEGDKAMRTNNYSIARFYYHKALGLKPGESYPQEQLKMIEKNLNTPAEVN